MSTENRGYAGARRRAVRLCMAATGSAVAVVAACGLAQSTGPAPGSPLSLRILGMVPPGSASQPYHGTSLPATSALFSADSPWNTPIASSAQADPNSSLMISTLKARAPVLMGGLTKWTFALHVIDASVCRRVDVPTTSDALYPTVDPDGNRVAEGLPIPSGIWPDPMSDGHMILVDPRARRSWEFSRFQIVSDGVYRASRIDVWDLDGTGVRTPFGGARWWTSGALGGGVPLIAGLIRPEEIEAGEIRHALVCATPVNRRASTPGGRIELCAPASRSDGGLDGVQYIPEGARLQLDPALNLDSLGLSPDARVVARAMQVYGLINAANAQDFKVFFQNLGADGGKWAQHPTLPEDLAKIPVLRFRVLRMQIVAQP